MAEWTLADVGQVNAQLAQQVSATNFLMDVNASGTLTPPVIVINKPLPGDTVRDDIALDVSIHDAVDKNIDQYEIQVGRYFVSNIDPRTGRSKQHIFNGAKPDGTITTTITVRAYDASGNLAEQSVTVNQIRK